MRSSERESRVEHEGLQWREGSLTPGRYDAEDRSPLLSRGPLISGPLSLGTIDLADGHHDRATWLICDVRSDSMSKV